MDVQLRQSVEEAIRAPSGHNTQPWRFRIGERYVDVLADLSRRLPVVDPDDRALVISCGAAVFGLRVALGSRGHSVAVEPLDGPEGVARVRITGETPADASMLRLARVVPARVTNRAAYSEDPVATDVLGTLSAAAMQEGTWLACITDPAVRARLADMVAAGDRAQFGSSAFRAELASWTRSNSTKRGDGIPGYAMGVPGVLSYLGPFFVRRVIRAGSQAKKDRALAAQGPVLAVLGTSGDTRGEWLAAGQALYRVLLEATQAGLHAAFMNPPIETASLRPDVAAAAGRSGERARILLRLGVTERPPRATPRRPAAAVLQG